MTAKKTQNIRGHKEATSTKKVKHDQKFSQFLCENGKKATAEKFSSELEHAVTKSMAPIMKKTHSKVENDLENVPCSSKRRPLVLG